MSGNKLYEVLAFTILLFAACSKDSTDFHDAYVFDKKVNSGLSLNNEKVIICENSIGSVNIEGRVQEDTILVYMYKSVLTESQEYADSFFPKMQLVSSSNKDTLSLSVNYDYNKNIQNLNCAVYLTVLYQMACKILNVKKKVTASYLDNELHVVDAFDDIEVIGHTSSCNLITSNGDITMQVDLPDSGYCIAETQAGDILLNLPKTASADVYVSAPTGTIGIFDLDLTNVVQTQDSLTAVLNNGHGTIRLMTNKGNVTLKGL